MSIYSWTPAEDTKLANLIITSISRGKRVDESIVHAAEIFKITKHQCHMRWYIHVRPKVMSSYERAVELGKGVTPAVPKAPVIETQPEVQKEPDVPALVEQETPLPVAENVVEDKPRAESPLLDELKSNTSVYNALTLLIQRFSKMEVENNRLKSRNKRKDQRITQLERANEDLNRKLENYRSIASGR